MSRYIDADNAIERLGAYLMTDAQIEYGGLASEDIEDWIPIATDILKGAPSIDIEPKRGEWIPYEASLNFGDGEGYVIEHKCSACGYLWGEPDYKFCPNCGADMREREGE